MSPTIHPNLNPASPHQIPEPVVAMLGGAAPQYGQMKSPPTEERRCPRADLRVLSASRVGRRVWRGIRNWCWTVQRSRPSRYYLVCGRQCLWGRSIHMIGWDGSKHRLYDEGTPGELAVVWENHCAGKVSAVRCSSWVLKGNKRRMR